MPVCCRKKYIKHKNWVLRIYDVDKLIYIVRILHWRTQTYSAELNVFCFYFKMIIGWWKIKTNKENKLKRSRKIKTYIQMLFDDLRWQLKLRLKLFFPFCRRYSHYCQSSMALRVICKLCIFECNEYLFKCLDSGHVSVYLCINNIIKHLFSLQSM